MALPAQEGALDVDDPAAGIAFGYTRRRFGFAWHYPEHRRPAGAVAAAVT